MEDFNPVEIQDAASKAYDIAARPWQNFQDSITAADTHAKNLQAIRDAKAKHDQDVQAFELDKKQKALDLEKAQGQIDMTGVQRRMLEQAVKDSSSQQQDVLDAKGTLIDNAEHQTAMQLQAEQARAKNILQIEPSVHQILANIMPMTTAAPTPGQGAAQRLPNIPVGGQILANNAPQAAMSTPSDVQAPVQPSADDNASNVAPTAPVVPINQAPAMSWAEKMQALRDKGLDPDEMFKGSGVYIPKAVTPEQQQTMEMQKERFEEARQKTLDARFSLMDKNLDPSGFRQGALGQEKVKYDSGERLMQLLQQGKGQEGGLDSRQTVEAAMSLQNMLSPGNASVVEVMSLVPNTAKGSIAKMQEWLDSAPHGAGQQKFSERVEDTAIREMSTLQSQMDRTLISRIAGFRDLKSKDEDRFNEILQNKGLTQDKIDAFKKGGMPALIKYNKEQLISGGSSAPLPKGVTEDDIQHTMKLHPGVTREQILQHIGS